MGSWEAPTLVFFVYTAAVASVLRGLTVSQRTRALAGVALGTAILFAQDQLSVPALLRTWIVPPLLLPVAYWTSGMLFAQPMPAAEALLKTADDRLRIRQAAAQMPRPIAELLEFAYAGIYPLIPLALALHLSFGVRPDPDRFWAVVLTTDYICFGMLPWIRTRPPRALETTDPWRASFRSFNLRLLERSSIHVNTLPSGHAAEAVAAALVVSDAPAPIAISMAFSAIAVSAGAVLGRYHYAADAIAGALVAFAVWWLARP
jgi:hypothetical protein